MIDNEKFIKRLERFIEAVIDHRNFGSDYTAANLFMRRDNLLEFLTEQG